jgi:hypothetical protein
MYRRTFNIGVKTMIDANGRNLNGESINTGVRRIKGIIKNRPICRKNFPLWNKAWLHRSSRCSQPFSMETEMTTLQVQQQDELVALRDLEKAIRACGLPSMIVSGQKTLELLATALQKIEAARRPAA